MRLVRVKRRSTAHYQRHQPQDVDWSCPSPLKKLGAAGASVGSGLSVARQFNRVSRLEAEHEEWLRRTLQRVALAASGSTDGSREERLDSEKASQPSGAAVSSHQLRQQQRDRLIQERRERGRSLLSWQQQQQQEAAAADTAEAGTSLTVKSLIGSRSDAANARDRGSEKATSLSKQLKAPPPLLTLSPTPFIQQAAPAVKSERQQLQPVAKQPHQTQLHRPRLRGPAVRSRQLEHSSPEQRRQEPQLLSIGQAPGIQQDQRAAQAQAAEQSMELADYVRTRQPAMRLREPTLVQPRNPVNSPELLAP
ncbi:hypothetical protein BOX15_Mlig005685g2 [Macrostomum lignano]|uniref:Uncharacterized protein n=1 Tax=Macrostomum lignano TaxID=282301 RepID=A0A267E8V7_9PLAT|nr:hypothetical protein BOX15_Mlig005685g2 [Macrostomum lignano]